MQHRVLLLASVLLLAACGRSASAPTGGPEAVTVAAAAETVPTAEDGANGVAIWVHPEDGSQSLILGAAGTGGLEVYGLDGALRQRIGEVEASHVVVRPDFEWNGGRIPLVLVTDPRRSALVPFTIDEALRVEPLPGEPIAVEDEMTGVCTFRSPISGSLYALATTDGGLLKQWQLFSVAGAVKANLVRAVPIGPGTEFCAVADESATLYYADEYVGLMSLPAEPESDASRIVIDMAEPRGTIAGEIKGIAFAAVAGGFGRIVAADVSAERFAVYAADGTLVGRFRIGPGKSIDAVGEGEGVALVKAPLGELYPEGLLVVADPENDGAHGNFKLVGWREIRTALGLPAEAAAAATAAPAIRAVMPALETAVTETWGDAADDPAIWVHPENPLRSVVIATDKNLGLYVYDLDGRLLQTVRDGRMNNVDVRDGFMVGGRSGTLVAASNRTDKSIALYLLDPATRQLSRIGAPVPTGFKDPYGLCMYASRDGAHYVFVNNADDGLVRQWRIRADGAGIAAEQVREFLVGSQAEGCVADDETGKLYVAEEDGAFWVYGADPGAGSERREIDRVDGPNGLKGDIEGVAIWHGEGGNGYLVVSNQGADNYAVYRREGDNAFVGLFQIVADPQRGIDGVSETDGLELTSRPLGPRFPEGLLVVQDGRNIAPRERQNFKYVSWRDVAAALRLNPES